MISLRFLTVPAILGISTVYAQTPVAEVVAYSSSECSGDAFSSSVTLTMYEKNKVLSGGTWDCMYSINNLPGFDDDGTYYTIYVDQKTIPQDCQLVLYQGPPKGEEINSGQCQVYYAQIKNSNGGCTQTRIAHEFGYALCCGKDCEAAANPGKRSLEAADTALTRPAPRDVSAVKRTNPLNVLQRRADCSFSGKGDSVTTYGTQVRMAPVSECNPAGSGCSPSISVTYETSTTNTFGVSAEIGASLFEIVSVSVSFSAEVSKEESHSYTWEISSDVPAGQHGYYTFQPRYECTPEGSFSGNECGDAPINKNGRVCYPTLVSGHPDGIVSFVQDV